MNFTKLLIRHIFYTLLKSKIYQNKTEFNQTKTASSEF